MMKNYLILCILLTVFSVNTNAQANKITIKGTIDTIPGSMYIVSFKQNHNFVADTIFINDAKNFEYETSANEPIYIRLSIPNTPSDKWYDPDILGSITRYSFYAEPGKTINFKGTAHRKQSVSNSVTENESLKFDTMVKAAQDAIANIDRKTKKRIWDKTAMSYIRNNEVNYFSLILLNQLDNEESFMMEQLQRTPPELRSTYLFKEIDYRLKAESMTAIGQKFPLFEMADTTGTKMTLKSFKDKYVLIDFWASWCAPCRKEHPFLLEAYQKYKEIFHIISISLDENIDDWMKAIKEDQLTWTQLSDLKGLDNELAKKLYIRSIPTNFLLDPNGIIITKDLRGDKVIEKISRISF